MNLLVAFQTCCVCGETVAVNAEKNEPAVCYTHSYDEIVETFDGDLQALSEYFEAVR